LLVGQLFYIQKSVLISNGLRLSIIMLSRHAVFRALQRFV